MTHLHDVFDRDVAGSHTAYVVDDGVRVAAYTADEIRRAAEAMAQRLAAAAIGSGDRVVLCAANGATWVVAFWGVVLRGATVVPIDVRTSRETAERVVGITHARLVLADGDGPDWSRSGSAVEVWPLSAAMVFDRPLQTVPLGGDGDPRVPVTASTVAEIVFTSGTSGDPKGVVITHGNLVANIMPIERGIAPFRRYVWLLRPIRFLATLPLSHLFGQALAMFLPPIVSGTTVFAANLGPGAIVDHVRRHRITLVVTVPRLLDLLRAHMSHRLPECRVPSPAALGVVRRLWRYRRAHRHFGWRFVGFVVGGAALDAELEEYWRRLAFLVAQGYGLTETAPIVAWNHPFSTGAGTVGRPIEGTEVRVADDGEVLVRGPVVAAGYAGAGGVTRATDAEGWLHTGDLGALDADGRLHIVGRSKDLIVTAEGINVPPHEIEAVLNRMPGVRESAVVSDTRGGEHVHAVLVLAPEADAATLVQRANRTLPDGWRIRTWSIWPGSALPRTDALGKLQRAVVRRAVASEAAGVVLATHGDAVDLVLSELAHGQPLSPDTSLDALGLSSLDRIALTMQLEARAGASVDDDTLTGSATVDDVRRLTRGEAATSSAPAPLRFPWWAQRAAARVVRATSLHTWVLPLVGTFLRVRVHGREHVEPLAGPVIFAANHQGHVDMPALLMALPRRWRTRVAVAIAKEYFDAWFEPGRASGRQRWASGVLYGLVALFFQGFPLPQRQPGVRQTLRYAGTLVDGGISLLVFPEGRRTDAGELSPFRPGIGMMAVKLRVPVVPVRIVGSDRVWHRTWRAPRRGRVDVYFGAPRTYGSGDAAAIAREVEDAVTRLAPVAPPAPS